MPLDTIMSNTEGIGLVGTGQGITLSVPTLLDWKSKELHGYWVRYNILSCPSFTHMLGK